MIQNGILLDLSLSSRVASSHLMMVSGLGDSFERSGALSQDSEQSLEDGAHDEGPSRGTHHRPQLTAAKYYDGRHAAERLLTCRTFEPFSITCYLKF